MDIKYQKKIARRCKRMIKRSYSPSASEVWKKRVELFHLLVFAQRSGRKLRIRPHEPGDFVVRDRDGTHLFEIVTIFGSKQAYIHIDQYFRVLFDSGRSVMDIDPAKFKDDETDIKDLLIGKLREKNEKEYFRNTGDYRSANLLLVTAEYASPVAIPWFSALAKDELADILACKNFTQCYVLDYFAGRNGDPVIFSLEESIRQANCPD